MRWKAVLLALAMIAGAVYLDSVSGAAPRPRVIPEAWQLNFIYSNPRAIRLKLQGQEEPQTFWYMIYTVINQTGEDRRFRPEFVLYTQSGDLHRAGWGVRAGAFSTIKKLHNEPLLRATVSGKLLQGEDNAKHGVAIWPDFDPQSETADIFIGGLSGETADVTLPKPIKKVIRTRKGETKTIIKTKITLSRTLQLRFKFAGGVGSRHLNPPTLVDATWVMR